MLASSNSMVAPDMKERRVSWNNDLPSTIQSPDRGAGVTAQALEPLPSKHEAEFKPPPPLSKKKSRSSHQKMIILLIYLNIISEIPESFYGIPQS
jgi:hypothetical protein